MEDIHRSCLAGDLPEKNGGSNLFWPFELKRVLSDVSAEISGVAKTGMRFE